MQPEVEKGAQELVSHQHWVSRADQAVLHHHKECFSEHFDVVVVEFVLKTLPDGPVLQQLYHQNAEKAFILGIEGHELVADDKREEKFFAALGPLRDALIALGGGDGRRKKGGCNGLEDLLFIGKVVVERTLAYAHFCRYLSNRCRLVAILRKEFHTGF